MNISILILTLNEEMNLQECLDTVSWSNDIVVLDSFSSDKTCDIAQLAKAQVVKRRFDNWSSHQNWALDNIVFKNPWVFYLDADERMTPELQLEMSHIAKDQKNKNVAYYSGRKNIFMGRWIRHAMPPGAIMRFFKPDRIRFERLVNPVPVIDGPHGYLTNAFLHYNFSKGLAEWFDKHNKYSTLEAMEGIRQSRNKNEISKMLFNPDIANRRKALKELSFHLPFRPLLKFIYMYVFKRGFLDGGPGFTYCVLQSIYEYMIVLKMKEIRYNGRGLKL